MAKTLKLCMMSKWCFQNPDEKAREQLEKNKANFEDWFGRDLGDDWQYLSAIFCVAINQEMKSHLDTGVNFML